MDTTINKFCPTCKGDGSTQHMFDNNCEASWAHQYIMNETERYIGTKLSKSNIQNYISKVFDWPLIIFGIYAYWIGFLNKKNDSILIGLVFGLCIFAVSAFFQKQISKKIVEHIQEKYMVLPSGYYLLPPEPQDLTADH